MDTSQKYILMCERAKEIQKEWQHQEGDFCYVKKGFSLEIDFDRIDRKHRDMYKNSCLKKGQIEVIGVGYYWAYESGRRFGVESEDWKNLTWLPRQDQLQEMLSDYFAPLQTMCGVIYDLAVSEYGGGFTIDGSMEQLWLAFVMQEKYEKQWDETKEEWQRM